MLTMITYVGNSKIKKQAAAAHEIDNMVIVFSGDTACTTINVNVITGEDNYVH